MNTTFALGFRPFYLLAAIFALIALPLWMSIYFGLIQSGNYLHGLAWHSHEMIFGFASAVIAGFLLTAVRNWTGRPTPTGTPLAALVTLWMLGRILLLTGFSTLAAVVDLLFLPAIAVSIAIPIVQSGSLRNLKIVAVLSGLALTNLGFHLAHLDYISLDIARLCIVLALDIIVILMAVMAGRVIPVFTANAVSSAKPKTIYAVEVIALGSLLVIAVAEVIAYWYPLTSNAWSALFLIASLSHGLRLLLWQPFSTRHQALLWMLPLAYLWIPIALGLRAAAALSVGITATTAFHALTVGAMASLMLAMITRSALGHTGRALKAGPIEIITFLLIQAAAISRVVPALIWPQQSSTILLGSAVLWSLAFAVFLSGYWTILTQARIDGQPG